MDARIDQLQRRAAASAEVVTLAGGLPAEAQFPKQALALAFLKVLRRSGAPALQYGWAEGSETLREIVAARLRGRGAPTEAGDVIVTSGAQQGIAIALELVARAGDKVHVARETYPAALELLRARRLVPTTDERRARVAYTMPVVGNPVGVGLGAEARQSLLASGRPIIEDDAYADLRFAGPPPPPLLAEAPDCVLHVGTFSKTLCPGLRIGWLIVPRRLRKRARDLKLGGDLQASSLAQAIIEAYLTDGEAGAAPAAKFEARLVRLRRFYRARSAMLAKAIRRHLPAWTFQAPEGGFAIWAEAPAEAKTIDEVDFLRAALAEGVSFDPGSMFRADGASAPTAVRLCFSAAAPAAFPEGTRRLARAFARAANRNRRGA